MSAHCYICARTFPNTQALEQHKEDSSAHLYDCLDCDRWFGSADALEQHLRDSPAHFDDSSDSSAGSDFDCKACDRFFASEDALSQHLRYSPAHAVTFECELCCREFDSESALQQHLRDSPAHYKSSTHKVGPRSHEYLKPFRTGLSNSTARAPTLGFSHAPTRLTAPALAPTSDRETLRVLQRSLTTASKPITTVLPFGIPGKNNGFTLTPISTRSISTQTFVGDDDVNPPSLDAAPLRPEICLPPPKPIDRTAMYDAAPPPPLIDTILTHDMIHEAVITPNGDTYDRPAIEKWIREDSFCPVTGSRLAMEDLRPNRALQKMVDEWKEDTLVWVIL